MKKLPWLCRAFHRASVWLNRKSNLFQRALFNFYFNFPWLQTSMAAYLWVESNKSHMKHGIKLPSLVSMIALHLLLWLLKNCVITAYTVLPGTTLIASVFTYFIWHSLLQLSGLQSPRVSQTPAAFIHIHTHTHGKTDMCMMNVLS